MFSLTAVGQVTFSTYPPDAPLPFTASVLTDNQVITSIATAGIGGSILNLTQSQPYTTTSSLPIWKYRTIAGQNRDYYSGYIVGSDPTLAWSTTVSVPVVPVIVKVVSEEITWTFDPTQPDNACLPAGRTASSLFFDSPLFTQMNWTMNGQFIPSTQYLDAEVRSEFWNYPGFAGQFAQRLNLAPTQFPPLVITVNGPLLWDRLGRECGGVPSLVNTTNPPSAQGYVPYVLSYGPWLTLDDLITQYVDTHEILTSQFPVFLLYKTIIAFPFEEEVGSDAGGGIAYGIHTVTWDGHTYAIADFEENDFFGVHVLDTTAPSHEMGEWLHDPFVTPWGWQANMTPPYGDTPDQPWCQNDFEVADPLNGTLITATYNAFTYHLNELAYFDWFYGGNSSTTPGVYHSLYGAGGLYSSNGTFTQPATLCGRGAPVIPDSRPMKPARAEGAKR